MDQSASRELEHAKYETAYRSVNYAMGQARQQDAILDLKSIECRDSYLDVSCGRGEMLDHATRLGFKVVQGTEIVPDLIDGNRVIRAEVHALPFEDNSFDVVSMLDVIEHLLPGDDELACKELLRVARNSIFLTANNKPSHNDKGDNLHINIRSYEEWNELFCKWFPDCDVQWLKARHYVSHGWRVEL